MLHPFLKSTAVLLFSFRTCFCRTTCTTFGGVEGRKSAIKCQFPEDIAVHRHSVNILKYDLLGQVIMPDLLLKCYWPKGLDFPVYDTSQGFEFDGYIGTSVTLSIPNTTKEHAGLYMCDYSVASLQERDGCQLQVKGNEITCKAPDTYHGDPANVTCFFNSDLTKTKNHFFVYRILKDKKGYEDILACNFLDSADLQTFCYVKPGFDFIQDNDLNDNRVTVHIRNAKETDSAMYYCDTVPNVHGVSIVGCSLNVVTKVKPGEQNISSSTSSNNVITSASTLSSSDRDISPENGGAKLGQSKIFFLQIFLSYIFVNCNWNLMYSVGTRWRRMM